VRQRLKADKERSRDRSYNRRKFHGPELPREPARCSRNWLVRLTFSSPASTLWGNEQKLRSHWCNKIALLPGLMFSSPASTLLGNEQKLHSHWCSKIALPPHHRLNLAQAPIQLTKLRGMAGPPPTYQRRPWLALSATPHVGERKNARPGFCGWRWSSRSHSTT
jgi:hypothetical protein